MSGAGFAGRTSVGSSGENADPMLLSDAAYDSDFGVQSMTESECGSSVISDLTDVGRMKDWDDSEDEKYCTYHDEGFQVLELRSMDDETTRPLVDIGILPVYAGDDQQENSGRDPRDGALPLRLKSTVKCEDNDRHRDVKRSPETGWEGKIGTSKDWAIPSNGKSKNDDWDIGTPTFRRPVKEEDHEHIWDALDKVYRKTEQKVAACKTDVKGQKEVADEYTTALDAIFESFGNDSDGTIAVLKKDIIDPSVARNDPAPCLALIRYLADNLESWKESPGRYALYSFFETLPVQLAKIPASRWLLRLSKLSEGVQRTILQTLAENLRDNEMFLLYEAVCAFADDLERRLVDDIIVASGFCYLALSTVAEDLLRRASSHVRDMGWSDSKDMNITGAREDEIMLSGEEANFSTLPMSLDQDPNATLVTTVVTNGAEFSCRPLYIADEFLRCTLSIRRRNVLDMLSQWVSHRSETLPAVYYEPKPGVLDDGTLPAAESAINAIAEKARWIIEKEEQKLAIVTDFCKHNYFCRCKAAVADMKKRAEDLDGLMARLLQQSEGYFDQTPFLRKNAWEPIPIFQRESCEVEELIDMTAEEKVPLKQEEVCKLDEFMDITIEEKVPLKQEVDEDEDDGWERALECILNDDDLDEFLGTKGEELMMV